MPQCTAFMLINYIIVNSRHPHPFGIDLIWGLCFNIWLMHQVLSIKSHRTYIYVQETHRMLCQAVPDLSASTRGKYVSGPHTDFVFFYTWNYVLTPTLINVPSSTFSGVEHIVLLRIKSYSNVSSAPIHSLLPHATTYSEYSYAYICSRRRYTCSPPHLDQDLQERQNLPRN